MSKYMVPVGGDKLDNDLHSLKSDEKAYIRFINKTDRTIELVWINFKGEYWRYQVLRKDEYLDVNTYKTHPWMALDQITKDRMHVDSKFLFLPKTSAEYLQERYPDKIVPEHYEMRMRVYVTLPMYSLKYAALLSIRNRLRNTEDADVLELPRELIEELKRTINHRKHMCSTVRKLHVSTR
ncbi:unnamed protein product [Phaedon cochleariae]|uniref:von Hippel-Lindau disease tumour suppressor beta domain-containing protein n=1 Tax=Phaedon cochleariae TaxID=80249 RepID=A0A9N9X0A1_PHACE|nr:unnamed protein product [Phaedon cochleariae]